ncbi:hypothetical protein OIU84_023461 [Salix udensis]|uniref:Uncharacterized protein n=1 Tax=Salix udensis TaxID=889485 RepID=A0AAD6KTA8_9ROSI|nr:hypothetical protein OIU84_023461 [Salix udensis]
MGRSTDLLSLRKPSWLATHSIYVVGSSTDNGIHLLDFYPDPSSPCHVDYSPIEDVERPSRMNSRNKQNRFLPLSEGVTACAAHPPQRYHHSWNTAFIIAGGIPTEVFCGRLKEME